MEMMMTAARNMVDVAIVGAGPYGLSIAAHLRHEGIPFRIFGKLMDSWKSHMPKGMMLKSDGFASNLDDPEASFTLGKFCASQGIPYGDTVIPVRLDTFTAYGEAFQKRMVPELEDKFVTGIEPSAQGFMLKLDDGENFPARKVILAVGITHFQYMPESLSRLGTELATHSYVHHDLEAFRGRTVVVFGGGASATDLAGLLRDADADVHLVARQPQLKFHGKPDPNKKRTLWQNIRAPQSGLGPGWRSYLVANHASRFRHLPEGLRLEIVRTHLGPSGGWFAKEKVVGRVPLHLGYSLEKTEAQGKKIRLQLRAADGKEQQIEADHLIAATGYKVDMERLQFLSGEIRSKVRTVGGSPLLSATFESSVPGIYFAGLAAANTFGPLMRFAFGAAFSAERLREAMVRSLSRSKVMSPVPRAISPEKEEAGTL
jgi:thioredoxin reductase